MPSVSGNLFDKLPEQLPEEIFETILQQDRLLIERIVSQGHVTPINKWYDQENDEWILLLQGGARILLQNNRQPFILRPGDYLFLPAHTKHRVEWTEPNKKTIWLAIHTG
jgi:cupin 2 domain-containing protein